MSRVHVYNVPSDIVGFNVAVWADKDDTNIKWYEMQMDESGNFYADVKLAEYGEVNTPFTFHLYAYYIDGSSKMIKAVEKTGIESICNDLFNRHLEDYSAYFNEMSLSLGNHKSENEEISTPELLKNVSGDNTDLIELYAKREKKVNKHLIKTYILVKREYSKGSVLSNGKWECTCLEYKRQCSS